MSCPMAVVSVGLGCSGTQGARIQLGDVRTHREGGTGQDGFAGWQPQLPRTAAQT